MLNIESYKRREAALILMNIMVLAALFIVHIVFLFEIGVPSKFLIYTLAARFIILIFELLWVQKLTIEKSASVIRLQTHLSIWLNIIFAFVASIFGGTPDSHYSVLMIIPIIQAAYYFNLPKTLGVTLVAIVLTFLEVWIYFKYKPPIDYGEFFEAATVSLIFFVVGIVVWLLVGNLREEESKLVESLAKLKETQDKLVSEEKMAAVGQLSSAIAHEIRNPVAMIASSLEMASKQPENSPLKAEMFEIAAQESKRLEILTDDFLMFARTKEPEIRQNNVCENLEYVASLARAKLTEKQIAVTINCDKNFNAGFDAGQIRQALLNLLMNAADASPENGRIELGCAESAGMLKIYVENDGEAIENAIVERIFEPFYTEKPKGTGLGLAIARKIARAHGGDLVLAYNETGRVRFEIELPK